MQKYGIAPKPPNEGPSVACPTAAIYRLHAAFPSEIWTENIFLVTLLTDYNSSL
jgi:hypothetical protein